MCTNPYRLQLSGVSVLRYGQRYMSVPCGKCCECRIKYQNQTAQRIAAEYHHWKDCATFLTLTYAPEFVPYVVDPDTAEQILTLSSKDIQRFFHSVRTNLKRKNVDLPFKYFVAQEYGRATKKNFHQPRPHYHIILFGVSVGECYKYFTPYWKKGFYKVKIAYDDNLSHYLAKYCSKGTLDPRPKLAKKPRNMVSRYFGFHLSHSRIKEYLCGYDTPQQLEHAIINDYLKHSNNVDISNPFDIAFDAISRPSSLLGRVCKKSFIMSAKGHKLSIPNSWRQKIYGYCTTYRKFFPDADCPHSQNLLLREMAIYNHLKNLELYNTQYRQIRACNPSWKSVQIESVLARQKAEELNHREQEAFNFLRKYYSKSKIT